MRISRDEPWLRHSSSVSVMPGAETSHIATSQPSATSWRTSSRPIPLPPPVTTASLPAKVRIASLPVPQPRSNLTVPLAPCLGQLIPVDHAATNDWFARAGSIVPRLGATPRDPPAPRAQLSSLGPRDAPGSRRDYFFFFRVLVGCAGRRDPDRFSCAAQRSAHACNGKIKASNDLPVALRR